MLDLSVIIVSWNTRHLLLDCLSSLETHLGDAGCEIIVVDNASTDGSADAVASEFPRVRLIRNDANLGFSRASNQAIRQAQGRYVLLLNPDARVLDDTLSHMVALLDQHSDIGAIGCRIVDEGGQLDLRCARRKPTLLTEFLHETGLAHRFSGDPFFGQYLMSDWDHTSDRDVEVLSGACLMTRRSTVDEIGLLDEDYFMYGEDIDWCTRMRAAGWRVYFYGQGTVMHIGDASANQVRGAMNLEKLRSRHHYFRKHRGKLYAFGYRLLLMLSISFKQALYIFRAWKTADSSTRPEYQSKMSYHRQILRWLLQEPSNWRTLL